MDEKLENKNVNNNLQSPEESAEMYENSDKTPAEPEPTDWAKVVREDVLALSEEFPELSELRDICELENPMRYAALRDLGLTPAEAYLASARGRRGFDNRSHLRSSPMITAGGSGYVPERDMEMARELFSELSDAEIRKLYKRVN